jgi:signal transduction histidine kinase
MALSRLPLALRRKKRLRPRHAVIALSVLLVAAHAASTAYLLRSSYRRAMDSSAAALESTARSAELGTANSLFETNAMLVGIGRIVATALPAAPLDAPALAAVIREFDEQSLGVSDILILDDKGRLANHSSVTTDLGRNYAVAPFFKAFRPGMSARLFVGAPEPSFAKGAGSIMMSRPLYRNGLALGVVAAEVPIATFGDFYRAIAPTGETRIVLLRNDGVLIADTLGPDAAIGRVPSFAAALTTAARRTRFGLLSGVDGTDRAGLWAFRRLPRYPWIVSASRTGGQILAGWYRECLASLLGLLLCATTVAALAWIAVGALGRSQLAAAVLSRGEARLRRQTSLLQSTLENIGEGLSVFDTRGRLVAYNRRFLQLLDLPPHLAPGTTLAEILMRQAGRGDFGESEPGVETARRLNQFYRDVPVTKERVTPAGRILQMQRRAMPGGAILTVYSDITEIRESERKILRARSQAEAANHSKSEFLANMSHELRTPLNAIIGFSEIIANELFGAVANQKYHEYIKDILASSLHLLSIINDVLDMSKIEAGKLELAKGAVTLQRIIADAVRMMRERAEMRGISLISCVASDDVIVWADERALKQVLLNLLSNAIKFSDEGSTVTIRLAAVCAGSAIIEVEDRGIGMTDEEQERALQPFGQAKPVISRDYGGTGLGLPITKGLVEAHRGTLTISSRVGYGTTIRIVLPTEVRRSEAEVEDLVRPQPVRDG